MPDPSKLAKTTTIRLPQEDHQEYAALTEGAGLSVSESVRVLVQGILASLRTKDTSKMAVHCRFNWRTPDANNQFPEHVGDLQVTVTPPAGMKKDDLARVVFVTPEFFNKHVEPFRIDSFHFHRVNSKRIQITSSRISRNVLSFRLIDGAWRAGIFDYSANFDQATVEDSIRQAVTHHITSTVLCFMLGQLPQDRQLTQEEVDAANKILKPYLLADGQR
ncbi:hypothetical protein [Burkholderia cenocepacia]|uniref:hypothetical protein n=1 Tax=Burkholderia cenocepacia TaxID=95486 RepID=UPI0013E06859|nr:hypothetical protein [Burkholderia cenocepacia]MCW3587352.1 hypothetical protein [Burkholderia cenocepacia]MCW3632556.1 hypothetical protein [Burkholderia cenocepacia]MCW5181787.1 hypothetical protein [Burkholderia cenocepacia]NGO98078.1 hypothetical protein [Burkholderia cenocepacia]